LHADDGQSTTRCLHHTTALAIDRAPNIALDMLDPMIAAESGGRHSFRARMMLAAPQGPLQ
jgi:hypothetical protein